MLGTQQEKLLAHLRKQLDLYASVGILSEEQRKNFSKLSATHDEATTILQVTVPANDRSFEIESKIAFPSKITPDDLHADSLNTCRIRMGFSPVLPFRKSRRALEEEMKRLTNDGWDIMPSELKFDDPNSPNNNNVNNNGQNDFVNGGGGSPDFSSLPALHEITDPPTNPDDIVSYIHKIQKDKCIQCQKKLDRTRLGLGPYKARWCHEANAFCCETCNTGTIRCVLPAYAMLRWDFEPKVVRNCFGSDAEFEYSKPLLIPGAENPVLFDQVPVLQDLRRLRFQLSKLFDIGQVCKDFMKALTQEPERPILGSLVGNGGGASAQNGGAETSSSRRAAFFINERQRYLIQDSEMWSLSDLEQVHRACPTKMQPGPQAIQASREMLQKSVFAKFLQTIRDSMIRHVLSECRDCKLRAAHNCLECGAEQPIYSFDVRNCYECSRCHSVFHRKCWEGIQSRDETCPGCVDLKTAK